jgi:putative two-component system response regulator
MALRRGGIVHDIGKVAVPDAILLSTRKLTPEEWKPIRQHPAVGESICKPLRTFQSVLPIIRHHHEKLDGSGYPDGLKADQIPLTARIMSIVDIYDALTTKRTYRDALSTECALEIMWQEIQKGWWDAHVFAEFRSLLTARGGKLPTGGI